jgi:hypothetical protein
MISLKDCRDGLLYQINSINLSFGVFRRKDCDFIGIREKFNRLYLDTEHHIEIGPPYGSVRPLLELEAVPKDISLEDSIGVIDYKTQKPVAFDKPISEGGRGWYYIDTGLSSQKIFPLELSNKVLFEWIKNKEEQYLYLSR